MEFSEDQINKRLLMRQNELEGSLQKHFPTFLSLAAYLERFRFGKNSPTMEQIEKAFLSLLEKESDTNRLQVSKSSDFLDPHSVEFQALVSIYEELEELKAYLGENHSATYKHILGKYGTIFVEALSENKSRYTKGWESIKDDEFFIAIGFYSGTSLIALVLLLLSLAPSYIIPFPTYTFFGYLIARREGYRINRAKLLSAIEDTRKSIAKIKKGVQLEQKLLNLKNQNTESNS